MTMTIFYWILSILITFPLSHIFTKKALIMDYELKDETYLDVTKFFYIPYLNVIVSFLYLVWVIIKFKRPE
jgi:hypothetical protein